MTNAPREPDAVAERYARRAASDRYSMLRPDVWHTVQERQRAMLRLFARRVRHAASTASMKRCASTG